MLYPVKVIQSSIDPRNLQIQVKAALASAQYQSSISAVVISELENGIKITNSTIQAKKKQKLEATKTIDQLTQAIERVNGDEEAFELHIDE